MPHCSRCAVQERPLVGESQILASCFGASVVHLSRLVRQKGSRHLLNTPNARNLRFQHIGQRWQCGHWSGAFPTSKVDLPLTRLQNTHFPHSHGRHLPRSFSVCPMKRGRLWEIKVARNANAGAPVTLARFFRELYTYVCTIARILIFSYKQAC